MTFYGLSKMSTSHHWKLPTNIYPTRLSSLSQHSFQHSNRRLAIYRTLPHYRHSQLTSIWPIPNLEGASARLGSVRPLKPVTPEHTSRLCWHTGSSQRPSTRRHCSTPLHEVDCQDALMASQWMPISLLNVIIHLVVEQGFCNHIDHQHFVYTQQGILHVLCRITKRTKTNMDPHSTIERKRRSYILTWV